MNYKPPNYSTQLITLTVIFGAIFILGGIVPRYMNTENRTEIRLCVMSSSAFCYLFWAVIYISQINPLVSPEVSNVTATWISLKWGQVSGGGGDGDSAGEDTTGEESPSNTTVSGGDSGGNSSSADKTAATTAAVSSPSGTTVEEEEDSRLSDSHYYFE